MTNMLCGEQNPVPLTSVRKGMIGELAVQMELLKGGYNVFTPVIDDFGVDLVVASPSKSKFWKVQVKHITKLTTTSSVELRTRQLELVDIVSVYYAPIGVAHIPIKEFKKPKKKTQDRSSVHLALFTASNNQEIGRKYFYQFMKFPEFE